MNARGKADMREGLDAPVPLTPPLSPRESGRVPRWITTVVLFAAVFLPQAAPACSACFGKSDSDLAKGMNSGIFVLLAVVVVVLSAITSFFVYLARRASAHASRDIPDVTKQPS